MGENRQIINPALDHAGGGLQVSDMDRLHQVAPLRQEKVPPVSKAKAIGPIYEEEIPLGPCMQEDHWRPSCTRSYWPHLCKRTQNLDRDCVLQKWSHVCKRTPKSGVMYARGHSNFTT